MNKEGKSRKDAIRDFFKDHPNCTLPGRCDEIIAREYDCTEGAARAARYRVFSKTEQRPWTIVEEQLKDADVWFEGVEKAVPTRVMANPHGRATLVFENGFPRTELPHTCPKTGATALSIEEADEIFGWRKVGEFDDGTPKYIVQSWCRKARADAASRRRAEKQAV